MNEINFLREMVKDLQKHIQIIKKRINELDEENKEKTDGETKEKAIENEKNSTFMRKLSLFRDNIIKNFS